MSNRWARGIALKILYPLLMFAGSLAGKQKEKYQKFIIQLNNKLVRKEKFRPENVLLLLPHCLQINECDVRLTYNIYNCKRCGRCEIKDLIQLAEENHLNLFVATGGSLARRVIHEMKPDAVIAVACENDLSSGIADTYPLPILGITNQRPFGPCMNTCVDLSKVKEAILFFGKTA
ncbi:MAG: hypothetical protein H6Q92_712 [Nitrospirae bacterium]|nr:hypothetical protein [Nitrospirota bacterium]